MTLNQEGPEGDSDNMDLGLDDVVKACLDLVDAGVLWMGVNALGQCIFWKRVEPLDAVTEVADSGSSVALP